ncbi:MULTISPECIES: hypothetical protein [unclassified Paenibacillus]|uniref:hypothetical protein n=1 Tax=unclassified Paenibacillus TaxID=185978 RepID=UPI001AE93EA1|nr:MULTISPECIES: hypothetical protein [unclassified Paenibacillus]MBP1156149.1 hypothetical protein [Paenibacillus sp. PvP091]MBP1168465.1 hypothetical protein [Paenibacillus sp. PvR098]MBP2439493.1 hypothetical protein [Paenibacillus sp. PvP052]
MIPNALPKPKVPAPMVTDQKLQQILDSSRPLCKEDIIWMLEFIKKKVAEEDPNLMDLSQPRLLQNFRYFAEIALMLIQRRNGFDQEADRLKIWLAEASHGLHPGRVNTFRKASPDDEQA